MDELKLYYFKRNPGPGNFGDELNVVLLKKLFNKNVIHTSIQECDGICIGSILGTFLKKTYIKSINKPLHVWGSGFIFNYATPYKKLIRPLVIHAIRGKLTKNSLDYYKVPYKNLVYGDPGLLTSLAFPDLNFTKEYDWGIIPHYVDLNHKNLNRLNIHNYCIIDPTSPVEDVIQKIVKCKCILSSAMHGLIVADSFGIPNARLIISNELMGGDHKFKDYYSAFNLSLPPAIDLRKNKIISNTDIECKIHIDKDMLRTTQHQLLDCFPF